MFWLYWVKTTVLSNQVGDFFKFCRLLIMSELYNVQKKTSFRNSNLQLYNSRTHGGFWTSSQFIFFFPSTRLVFSSTRTEGSCACNDLIWFLLPRHQIWRLAYTKITYFLVENEHFSTVEKVSTYLKSNTNHLLSFVTILSV